MVGSCCSKETISYIVLSLEDVVLDSIEGGNFILTKYKILQRTVQDARISPRKQKKKKEENFFGARKTQGKLCGWGPNLVV